MLEFLLLTTYLFYFGISMETNCAPLLADFFLYSYESEHLQTFFKINKTKEGRSFDFTVSFIYDVPLIKT